MKITIMKAAFVMALLASGGAISLASESAHRPDQYGDFTTADTLHSTPETQQQQFYKWIQHQITVPAFIQSDEASNRVILKLEVDTDGKVNVLESLSVDPRLAAYVQQELQGRMYSSISQSGEYHFAIHFRRIS
jgi:hypothetical protein